MTPQLQQAIKLLQMSRLEMQQTINTELMENPVLEEVIESPDPNIVSESNYNMIFVKKMWIKSCEVFMHTFQ